MPLNHSYLSLLKSSLFVAMVSTFKSPSAAAFMTPNAFSKPSLVASGAAFQPEHQSIDTSFSKLYSHAIDSEDEAMMMMMKANTCAHSDTCSLEEAEQYLNEMLHIQSNCVSGTLQSDMICNDIEYPVEVIAGLRDKIKKQVEMSNQGSVVKIGMNPIFLTILALYITSGMLSLAHNNPDTFTVQEWMYALQGGYLDDMISQYLKYGGLSPMTTIDDGTAAIVPLSFQELWWSIRDGYLGNMITEYQNHGGFLSIIDGNGCSEDTILTTPMTTQEWTYATKDGYLSAMISHYMRNGGL